MTVRTVSVVLTAEIAAFQARMTAASRSAHRTAADIRTSMRNAGRTMVRVGENQRNALKMVQGASLGLVAAFGLAVAASARFEKAMAQVRAVTRASAGEMGILRAAAMEAGRTTKFSAVEAAGAQHELAKAGVSVADIAGGAMKGALDLASAAELNVAESAEIAANAMTVFNLKGKDVTHIADVLAAAANKSTTDVHQLGLSLRMTGQVAAQTGLSLEDTVGAMALFAAEGLKGSDAGTSFKVMLQRLTPQSKEAQATMDRLGFSAYDANGNFVGLQEVARRMKESFAQLTPEARNAAMGVIFGSDAVRAAGILYKHGAEGVRTYTDAVNDHGYAAAVAQTRMDHLIGDLELLKSALETALIETGTAANSALRDMVQWVTRVVNAYSSLPPGLQQTVGVMTGLVGILGLAGASMLLLLPRIMLVRRELIAMGVTAARTRGALLMMAKTGAVIGGLLAISYAVQKVRDQFKDAPPSVSKLANSFVDLGRSGKVNGEALKTLGKDLDQFGEAVKRVAHPDWEARTTDIANSLTLDLTKGLMEAQIPLDEAHDKIKSVDQALAELVSSGHADLAADSFNRLAEAAEKDGTSTEKLMTLLPGYAGAIASADTQTKLAADGQGALGDATAMTADEMADQRSEAEKLADTLNVLNGVAISAAEGQISFEQSLDDLTEAVKENGTSLDVAGEKGRTVKGAFLEAAKAAQEHAQAVADQKGSVDAGNVVLEENIAALRRTMKQAGFTDKQIRELIGSYAQLPPKSETQILAETQNAMDDLEAVQRKIKGTKGKTVTVDALTKEGQEALEDLGFKIKRTKGKKVTITVPTGTQKQNVEALGAAISNLRSRTVTVTTVFTTQGSKSKVAPVHRNWASGGRVRGYAGGGDVQFAPNGLLSGPGTGTSDSILALFASGAMGRVSDTEFVVNAASTRKYLPLLEAINKNRLKISQFASGGLVGYAKGGKTKKPTQSQINARREVPGDLGALGRALNDSAADIRSASNALITDLKKLGNAGWKLAKKVDATSRKLQALANKRDKVSARIAEAKDFARSTTGSVNDFLDVEGGGSAKSLIKDMKAEQKTAAQFKADINYLRKRGVHKDLIAQVIEEGPGGELAQTLKSATAGEMKQLNALAGKGSKLATSIGRLSADALYDAGKNASKGFLAGLIAEEKAIQKEMDKLGQSLIKAIKKALKIKSPSVRARDEVGKMFGRGVAQGVDLSIADVQASANRLSAAAISATWGGPPAASGPVAGGVDVHVHFDDPTLKDLINVTVAPRIRDSEQRQAYRAKVGRH